MTMILKGTTIPMAALAPGLRIDASELAHGAVAIQSLDNEVHDEISECAWFVPAA